MAGSTEWQDRTAGCIQRRGDPVLPDAQVHVRSRAATNDRPCLNSLAVPRLDWVVPDYSTLCRHQESLSVTIPARPNKRGLHLLIDITGVKMQGEGD